MALNPRRIAVVGMGPGSPDYVTPAGLARAREAEVLVGAARLLDLVPGCAGERVAVGADVEPALEAIAATTPRRVAVLVSGDPGLLSLARRVIERFGRDACEVIPGVSSVQVAFARLGLAWHDARILDAHGRTPACDPAELRSVDTIAVLTGNLAAASWLAAAGRALAPTHRVVALADLTLASERITEPGPADLAALAGAVRTIVLFLRKEQLP